MFFIMGIFLFAELSIQTKLKRIYNAVIILLLIAFYGCLIEYLQQNYFVHRSGDYWDLFADILGGVFCYNNVSLAKKTKGLAVEPQAL